MQTYIIKENGYAEYLKQFLKLNIPLILFATVVFVFEFCIENNSINSETNKITHTLFIITSFFIVGMCMNCIYVKNLFINYKLTLSDNLISSQKSKKTPISILFEDIIEISKWKFGGIIVKGKEMKDYILIPAQLENFEQIESVLQKNYPFQINEKASIIKRYPLAFNIFLFIMITIINTITNKYLVVTVGIITITIVIWDIFTLFKYKNSSLKINKLIVGLYLMLIFIIIGSIIQNLFFKT